MKESLSALRELDAEDLDLPEDEKYLDNALIVADDLRKFVSNKTTFNPELIAVLLIQLQDQEKRMLKFQNALLFRATLKRLGQLRLNMRVGYLLLGDSPFLNTGYANQLRLVAKCLLKEGRQVAFAAAYGFAEAKGEIELEYVPDMCWATVKVYPHDKFPGNLTQATLQKHIEGF